MSEKAHAEFSASGSSRWVNCPGSIKLSRGLPALPETIYAREGTTAHACLEHLLKTAIDLSKALSFDGVLEYLRAAKPNPGWDRDMMVHAKNAVAWIMREYYRRGRHVEVRCEAKVSSEPFTMAGQFGTLDAALIEPFGRLTIIDYKYGAGIAVDPLCSQLVYYALAVSHEHHHNFSEIELVVIQPRAQHESGKTIRRAVISIAELLKWNDTFSRATALALSKRPPLKSGDHCRYCPAAAKCPELVDANFKRAQIVFSRHDGIESVPEPKLVKAREIPVMLEAAERLELWIDELRKHAYHMLERGEEIEGWKLVEKRAARKWADPLLVKEQFGEKALGEPEVLSPAQLEKAIGKCKASKKFIKEWTAKHTIAQSNGVTMVRDSDKRIAVPQRAERVFGSLTIDV